MEQLYKVYENSVTVQTDVIKATNQRLDEARKNRNHTQVQYLNSLLKVLYEEKWELEERKREIRKYIDT